MQLTQCKQLPQILNETFNSGNGHLTLTKLDSAKGWFNDGLVYVFTEEVDGEEKLKQVKPYHITFEV
jgi:predicted DNA-binding transcriptional regulator YafY